MLNKYLQILELSITQKTHNSVDFVIYQSSRLTEKTWVGNIKTHSIGATL